MSDAREDRREMLRLNIERGQGDLQEAVVELRRVVEGSLEKVDLRRRIAADPMPWLAGAFVLGFMLGMRRT